VVVPAGQDEPHRVRAQGRADSTQRLGHLEGTGVDVDGDLAGFLEVALVLETLFVEVAIVVLPLLSYCISFSYFF
jgi:hypothetical protein